MHSEMQFKQHKIAISSRFTLPVSGKKDQKVERLANVIKTALLVNDKIYKQIL